MHPDLVAISNLWQADVTIDRLKAEIEGLIRGETRGAQRVEEATAAATTTKTTQLDVRKKVLANEQDLNSFTQVRDRTRAMLSDGSAPNYAAAERQLVAAAARIDTLETEGLELLEALDVAVAAQKAAEAEKVAALAALAAAREARASREAAARSELVDATGAQLDVAKLLPHDLRAPYAELRRKRRPALVNVAEGVCVSCQTLVPPHRSNEVKMSRALHSCAGCGGYLLP